MTTLEIRPVESDDAAALSALHAESFGQEGWSRTQIEGSLSLATTAGWIVFDGRQPAGFILCQILPEQTEILTFCVKPSHRRRKFGLALSQKAIEAARGKGNHKMFLEVAADNDSARRLYEQLGFRPGGVRAGYYKRGDRQVDAVLLSLNL